MRIQILQTISGADFFYRRGDVVDLPEAKAQSFINIKWAQALTENPILLETIKQLTKSTDGLPMAPSELDSFAEVAAKVLTIKSKLDTIEEGAQKNPDITNLATKDEIPNVSGLNESINTVSLKIDSHKVDEGNPHKTTKEQTGIKIKTHIINFIQERKKTQLFTEGYFTKTPEVKITLANSTQAPPYKTNVTKDGVTVVFPIIFTGNVTLEATEI